MNAHEKTQLTHVRIKCAHEDSNCDTAVTKIFNLMILASSESSSPTKVIQYPHIKKDFIFPHNDNNFNVPKSILNGQTHIYEHNA